METTTIHLDELKFILANIRHPDLLDEHPWTKSLVVRQGQNGENPLDSHRPGIRLITAISMLFKKLMPSTPPRHGKRLDTRWCQFGLLAAEYFAPFLYGTPYPTSLRDAWGRIDQVLPLFVFGKPGEELSEQESSSYRLFDENSEPTPVSTLSDWHANGLQELAALFLNTEQYLSRKLSLPSPILNPIRTSASLQEKDQRIQLSNAAGSRKRHKPGSWIKRIWIGAAGRPAAWSAFGWGSSGYPDLSGCQNSSS